MCSKDDITLILILVCNYYYVYIYIYSIYSYLPQDILLVNDTLNREIDPGGTGLLNSVLPILVVGGFTIKLNILNIKEIYILNINMQCINT